MYFRQLNKPISSNFTQATWDKLEEELALNWNLDGRVLGATQLARVTGQSLDHALEFLMLAGSAGVVKIAYELACPICGAPVEIYDSRILPQEEQKECPNCFEFFYPSAGDVWVSFSIEEKPDSASVKKR